MHAALRDRWWWAGMALAFAIMTRPHVALIALILGVGLAIHRRSWRPLFGIGVPSALGVALLTAWNRWMFGEWSVGGAYAGKMAVVADPVSTQHELGKYLLNAAGAAFTPGVGLFIFSPIALYALVWVTRSRGLPAWTWIAAAAGLAYQLMQLRLNSYTGGGQFYGNRLMVEMVVVCTPLTAAAYTQWSAGAPWRRFRASVVAGVSIATFAVGALLPNYLVGGLASEDWTRYYPIAVLQAAGPDGVLVGCVVLLCFTVFIVDQYKRARAQVLDHADSVRAKSVTVTA
jgi:hypothetical protein